MKVRVPTIVLEDDVLKSIRRAKGQNGKALREEAVEWVMETLDVASGELTVIYPPNKRAVARPEGVGLPAPVSV